MTRLLVFLWLCAPSIGIGAAPDVVTGDVDRRIWNGTPIAIDLQVGVERRVVFPVPVHLDIDRQLINKLRVQIVDGNVYLKASEAFASTRVIAGAIDTDGLFLLDLRAASTAVSKEPVIVAVPSTSPARPEADGAVVSTTPAPGYVSLTRWMARELYAPDRLRTPAPGVARVPIDRTPVPGYRGSSVDVRPIVAWRGHGLYLTAVQLQNATPEAVELDPRLIRGRWLTRALQHARLGPAGSPQDSTTAYLISTASFSESLR